MEAGKTGRVDVLIGGAGFAGLALAIALRRALGGVFTVAVADPALAGRSMDARASAIAASIAAAFARARSAVTSVKQLRT